MDWKQSTPSSDERGFTILEMLVASFLGLAAMALAIGATMTNRTVYHNDLARTSVQQNLRSALNLTGINIREAGENLNGSFPALAVADGTGPGGQDELVLRRNLLGETLWVCQAITAGSTNDVTFAMPGTTPGCIYGDNTHAYSVWSDYRTEEGGTVRAYIFDVSTGLGEFFNYDGETDDGSSLTISRSGAWVNDYTVGSSSVYMLEEWHFQVDETLPGEPIFQVIQNGETASPLNITYGITDFQVLITMVDSSVLTSFTDANDWTQVASLEVTLSGEEEFKGTTYADSVTARFFPRNILSN